MDENELRTRLQQLHDEIEKTQAVDEQGRELLRHIDGDIRALLARSAEHPVQVQPSFVKRLEDALCEFEVSHPDLTAVISKMLDTLSNAGI